MKDVAGRRLTDYFGPPVETDMLGPLTVVGGTANTRIYKTESGQKFTAPASANKYTIEYAAMKDGIIAGPDDMAWGITSRGGRAHG